MGKSQNSYTLTDNKKDSVVTNDEGEVAKEAISTQPRFDFTTEIINGNTLHIKPTENLKSNTRYEVKIDANVLQDSTAVIEELPPSFIRQKSSRGTPR